MVNFKDYNDFDKFLIDNREAIDSDLISREFNDKQLLIISSWLEEAYDRGFIDGRDGQCLIQLQSMLISLMWQKSLYLKREKALIRDKNSCVHIMKYVVH